MPEDNLIRREEGLEEQTLSPSASQKVLSMAMQPVMSGRWILFNFLDELGLELGDKLEEQG